MNCISDFLNFERTKKIRYLWKHGNGLPFFKACFTSYLEQTNGKFSLKMKTKPQEKHLLKPYSEVFNSGEEVDFSYNTGTYLTIYTQSLRGVINILDYCENA